MRDERIFQLFDDNVVVFIVYVKDQKKEANFIFQNINDDNVLIRRFSREMVFVDSQKRGVLKEVSKFMEVNVGYLNRNTNFYDSEFLFQKI